MAKSRPQYRTSAFERLSYGGFFLGQNIIYVIQFQYLTYFLTEDVGIPLATTALMLGVARVWDAINDPIMGAVIDRVRFKSGKFLPWIRVSAIAIPFALVLMFVNPNFIFGIGAPLWVRVAFCFLAILIWDFVYTLSDAPLFSLATAMTDKLYERDKLLAAGRLAAALAAISSAVYATIKASAGTTMTVGIYALIALIFMVPLMFSAKERVQHKANDVSFIGIFKYLFKNKPLLAFYIGFLAVSATNTMQSLAIYFAQWNLGDEGLTTVMLAVAILPVVLVSPLLPALIRVFGKKPLTIACSIISIALCVLQYFVGYESFYLFLGLAAIRVVFMQIPMLIYGMFTADCIEYCAYTTGKRTEGISFSLQTLMTKLGGSIVSILGLGIMGAFGYVEQASSQSASALEGIWLCMSLLPAAGYVIMLIVMVFFYHLNEKEVERMIAANEAAEAAEKAADCIECGEIAEPAECAESGESAECGGQNQNDPEDTANV